MKKTHRPLALCLSLLLALALLLPLGPECRGEFAQGEVRMKIDPDVPCKGTLETQTAMIGGNRECPFTVYLPYGYDPEDKTTAYDVLLMLPGGSGQTGTFMGKPYSTTAYSGKEILDDIFYHRCAKPSIIVTMASFPNMKIGSLDQMEEVIRQVVATLDALYNTYGNKTVQVELAEGEELRDHYVLAGFCYSADVLISVLIVRCNDLFSRFGVFSTMVSTTDLYVEQYAEVNGQHPIRCIMTSSGTLEPEFEYHTDLFSDRVEELGIPVVRFSYVGIDHAWDDNAFASLYNVVQLMFPPEYAGIKPSPASRLTLSED